MGVVIEFKNVTYSYPLTDEPVIRDMSFSLEAGKFYGVIGENGSGKTTLCSLIRGFAPSFYKGELEGEVLVHGKPTVDHGPGHHQPAGPYGQRKRLHRSGRRYAGYLLDQYDRLCSRWCASH